MRQDAIDAINAVKPYKGGNDTLRRLHRLNAIDKHRLLLTIGTAYTAHSMTPSERVRAANIYTGSNPGKPVPDLSGILITAHPLRILKPGDILRTIPEAEMEQHMQFHFDIAFNEPGIAEGEPIVVTLHQMTQLVGKIILKFWP
jgi:hypothetical protein